MAQANKRPAKAVQHPTKAGKRTKKAKPQAKQPERLTEIPDKYTDDREFLMVLNSRFDDIAGEATLEELAEFAFGSIEEAIEYYEEWKTRTYGAHNEAT